jgi:hypothetical protein
MIKFGIRRLRLMDFSGKKICDYYRIMTENDSVDIEILDKEAEFVLEAQCFNEEEARKLFNWLDKILNGHNAS